MSEVALAYVSIVPKFAGGFRDSISKAVGDAGKPAGQQLGKSIAGGLNLSAVGAKLQSIGGGLQSVGGKLTSHVTTPILGAATAAATLTAALGFKRLVGIDTARGQFKGLGYDADAVMKQVDAGVTNTALSMAEGAALAVGILATGAVPLQDLEDQIKRVSNVSAAYSVEASHAGYLLNNVLVKGKVTWGDLSQMQQNQIPIVSQLADMYGVSGEEIQKMASEGKISVEDLNRALDTNAGAAAEEYAKTWRGITSNILSNIGKIGAAFLEPTFEIIKDQAADFLELLRSPAFSEAAKTIGQQFAVGLQVGIEAIRAAIEWWNALDTETQKLIGMAAGIAVAFGPMLIVVGKVATAVGGIIAVVGKASGAMAGLSGAGGVLAGALRFLLGPWGLLIAAIAGAIAISPELQSMLGELAGTIGTVLMGAVEAFAPVITQLAEGIFPILMGAVESLVPALMGLVSALGPLVEVIGVVLGAIAGLIELLLPVLIPVLEVVAAVLVGAVQGAITGVTMVITGLTTVIQGVVDFVTAIFNGDWRAAWEALKSIVSGIIEAVAGAIWTWLNVTVLGAIRGGIARLVSMWSGGWTSILNFFRNFGTNASSIVSSFVTTVSNFIRNLMSAVLNFFRTGLSNAGSAVSSGLNAIRNFFTNILSAVRNVVSSALSAVTGFFRNGLSGASSAVSSGLNSIRNFFSNAMSGIRTAVSNGVNGVLGFFRSLPRNVLNALGNLGSLLRGSGRSLLAGFTGGIRDGFNKALDAVKGGLSRIRNFFPFSPAKEGPFSGSGYTDRSGRALMRDFVRGVESEQGRVRSVLHDALNVDLDALSLGSMGVSATVAGAAGRRGGVAQNITLNVPRDAFRDVNSFLGFIDGLQVHAHTAGGG